MGEVLRWLNEQSCEIRDFPIKPPRLAGMLELLRTEKINSSGAKKIFQAMIEDPADPAVLMDKQQLRQVSDSGIIEEIVETIIRDNPAEAEAYRGGKEKLMGFFMGQVMRASKGKANPQVITEVLKQKLRSP
jgi:aspartyl-tRNA(Asn)/glutamyl-tRNA(Gln) amidotransferase subunit B